MSSFNSAMSYNLRHAIITRDLDFEIDYGQVRLSKGFVPNPESMSVKSLEPGFLRLTWKGQKGYMMAHPKDKLFVAIYCESLNQWIFDEEVCWRKSGTCIIDITPFSWRSVKIYYGFISHHHKDASESQYLGMIDAL